VNQSLLEKNDRLAERNRGFFQAKGVFVLNMLSAPGSGKTLMIERFLADWQGTRKVAVITGDLATENDANRLRKHGDQVVQINTGNACHLDAEMIAKALKKIDFSGVSLLIIENVGNLVCPTMFDLGEDLRLAVLSVTEGEDKPLKYPGLFKTAGIIVINKMDLAQPVEFAHAAALANIKITSPKATIFEVSAKTGLAMKELEHYLEKCIQSHNASLDHCPT
jgi:hydrogenase nickel incorporation protein HypB